MARSGWSKTSSCDGNSAYFRVTVASDLCAAVALPEFDAGAFGVVVLGGGAECFFLLVVAAKAELQDRGDEEEKATLAISIDVCKDEGCCCGGTYAPMIATAKQAVFNLHVAPRLAAYVI